MEVIAHVRIEVHDPSQVGSARRHAGELARDAGLDETDVGRAALVTTELASNLVKHGGGGDILLRPLRATKFPGLEILALDRGRGMRSTSASVRDGFSTAGTPGTGLGAISRVADVFDLFSAPGTSTAVLARVHGSGFSADGGATVPSVGVICVAKPGEDACGDGWAVAHLGGRSTVLVIDGLGHGALAADASLAGIRIFGNAASAPPTEIVERLHAGLRATRGAALAVADVDWGRGLVRYSGIGNIAGTILCNGTTRSLVSHHGTAGHDSRRIQEFVYPFPPAATLVMNSDGLVSSWTVEGYPGILERHPALVAAMLYRDFTRGRDDSTVVVLREAA